MFYRGFIVPVIRDLGLPVKFIGVGERIEDLRDFDAAMFVDALLGNNEDNLQQIRARAQKILSSNKTQGSANKTQGSANGNAKASSAKR